LSGGGQAPGHLIPRPDTKVLEAQFYQDSDVLTNVNSGSKTAVSG
jgi:hypothetical protein